MGYFLIYLFVICVFSAVYYGQKPLTKAIQKTTGKKIIPGVDLILGIYTVLYIIALINTYLVYLELFT